MEDLLFQLNCEKSNFAGKANRLGPHSHDTYFLVWETDNKQVTEFFQVVNNTTGKLRKTRGWSDKGTILGKAVREGLADETSI